MKKINAKLVFFIIIVVVLAAAVAFIVMNAKKSNDKVEAAQTTAADGITIVSTPVPTVDPSTYSDVDVPDGITIVEAPEGSNDTYIGSDSSSSTSSSSGNNNIYIVDGPSDTSSSSSSGNGIYIVTTPSGGTSSDNGIYIVNTPNGSGSGGGSSYGTTIRSGSFSGGNGGLTLNVSYQVVAISSSTVQVTMDATLSHGNLNSTSEPLSFNCYGQYGSISAPSISGSGSTYLGSKTFTVNLATGESTTMALGASWKFNGTYSGQYIDAVSAYSTVSVYR